jgi:hypothetical protein
LTQGRHQGTVFDHENDVFDNSLAANGWVCLSPEYDNTVGTTNT